MFVGARLQYHFTDWLGVGIWGAYGVVNFNTGLTSEIDKVNKDRWDDSRDGDERTKIDRNASLLSVGHDFPEQLGKMQWVFSPQITAVPFRGKLALFEKLFVDTDIFFFAGPAFIGVVEREDYSIEDLKDPNKTVLDHNGKPVKSYPTASRLAIAPTFGAGLNFYPGDFMGFGLEYRAMPFSWNTSGFDSQGGPPDGDGPDYKIDKEDRQFRFNQMITISFSFLLPTDLKISP
jgi:hypothetical protein